MAKDWAFLDAHTTSSWVQLFVKVLLPRKLEVEPLARAYRAATRRVFCFGLDGTLIPQDTVITHLKDNHDFVGRGQAPSPAVLHCLLALAADPANEVHVLSGRGASDMSAIFGSIDRLGLAAELGKICFGFFSITVLLKNNFAVT
ncbi:hypothetical protein T492DRAFT_261073 [Pavlovales sp. CCMP2436]|nr:hypothetical protein T492DRAFT_261073 [Pavlovales sp. CCMP2436]